MQYLFDAVENIVGEELIPPLSPFSTVFVIPIIVKLKPREDMVSNSLFPWYN